LTNDWGIDVDSSWSPRGDEIAFLSDRQGNPHIFIMDVFGRKVRRLTDAGKYNATPAWSPKGDRIAFTRLEEGRFDIYTIRPDGSDERRLTFGPGSKEPPLESDGRFSIITRAPGDPVLRADGTGGRRISRRTTATRPGRPMVGCIIRTFCILRPLFAEFVVR
jgi:TolB protein